MLFLLFLKISGLQRHQLPMHWIIFVSFKHNVFSLICFNHLFTFISFCLFLSHFPCPLLFFSSFYYSLCCFQCSLHFCDFFSFYFFSEVCQLMFMFFWLSISSLSYYISVWSSCFDTANYVIELFKLWAMYLVMSYLR